MAVLGVKYNLKNPIWDLKMSSSNRGRQLTEGKGRYWEVLLKATDLLTMLAVLSNSQLLAQLSLEQRLLARLPHYKSHSATTLL